VAFLDTEECHNEMNVCKCLYLFVTVCKKTSYIIQEGVPLLLYLGLRGLIQSLESENEGQGGLRGKCTKCGSLMRLWSGGHFVFSDY